MHKGDHATRPNRLTPEKSKPYPMSTKPSVEAILRATDETLQSAEWGLADLLGQDPRRRMSGLRNLVVFGRAVTNALQNLRTAVGPDRFDAWYSARQEEMRTDELMRYFYVLRSQILKEGSVGEVRMSLSMSATGTELMTVMQQKPPPGAKGFFIGDHLGGSGWHVELPDGTTTTYFLAKLACALVRSRTALPLAA